MSILGAYEVSLDGVAYRVVQEQYIRRFLDVIRQQGGTQDEPGESSLNPNDLWRRSQDDFTHGQGQTYYDVAESDRKRFESSSGLDVSTSNAVTLSNRLGRVDSNAGAAEYIKAVATETAVYLLEDGSTTMEVLTSAQNTSDAAPQTIVDAVSDGTTLYVACNNGAGTGGIYPYTGTTLGAKVNDAVGDLLGFVRGRLMVAVGADLYNITDTTVTTLPSSLTPSMINSSFVWDAFGETNSAILAAGHGGDQSFIYRITLQQDGTALEPPLVAAQLPDGEFVRAMKHYLSVVVIATTKGIRIGQMSGDALIYGPLVHETTTIHDLEPRGNFVYYGADGAVWILDLGRFVENLTLVPSHSSHFVLDDAHDVVSVLAAPDISLLTTDPYDILVLQQTNSTTTDGGLFEVDRTTYVSTGTLTTSRVKYNMNDVKQFLFLEVVIETQDTNDIVYVRVIEEDGTVSVPGYLEAGSTRKTFYINKSTEDLKIEFQLDSGDPTAGTSTPTLVRWTLRALPVPSRTEQIQLPLDLRANITGMAGGEEVRSLWDEYNALRQLVISGAPVEYVEFDQSYLASVENVQWGPDLDVTEDNTSWEGVALVTLRLYDPNIYNLTDITADTSESMFGIGTFGSDTFGERTS